jgi:hypothetical protein
LAEAVLEILKVIRLDVDVNGERVAKRFEALVKQFTE